MVPPADGHELLQVAGGQAALYVSSTIVEVRRQQGLELTGIGGAALGNSPWAAELPE